jgi:hypothetical protein
MKKINLSQTEDREAWLQQRLGRITGSKSKGIKPLSRGKDRTPVGFWELLAEKIAIQPDGEKDIDRGQRLENEALEILAEKYKLKLNLDPGFWVSDEADDIAYSPDGAEDSDKPTWCAEAKCLSTKNHLRFLFRDKQARGQEDYKAIGQIPNDSKNAFREQIVQAFVVNENLKIMYFVLYDDRVAFDKYTFHVIEINRYDIEEEIQSQKEAQLQTLAEINEYIKEIKNGK